MMAFLTQMVPCLNGIMSNGPFYACNSSLGMRELCSGNNDGALFLNFDAILEHNQHKIRFTT